jgi:HD-like signal output (HDOD) protein
MQTVVIAHLSFSKPTNTEELVDAIKRIAYIKNCLNSPVMSENISTLKSLPVLPEIYDQLLAEINSDNCSLKVIADIISKDISLTSKILQLVNSSFFAFARRVNDINQAINLLGLDIIKDIVLSVNIFSKVDPKLVNEFQLSELWVHSLATAYISKNIALDLNLPKEYVEKAFIAGLLHDCGRLIMLNSDPDKYKMVINSVRNNNFSLIESEINIFGVSHNTVAAYLAGLWGFTQCIIEACFFNHSPNILPNKKINITTCVHMADFIHNSYIKNDEKYSIICLDNPTLDLEYIHTLNLEEKLKSYLDLFKDQNLAGFQIY